MVKKSFLKLPVELDRKKLRDDFKKIPLNVWTESYWQEAHGCVKVARLRGGDSGTYMDHETFDTKDHKALPKLKYLQFLLSEEGPFGKAEMAFIFRMRAKGVSTRHVDVAKPLVDTVRIHVPITTNKDAVLFSKGRAQHFEPGEVWAFDNQSEHAVWNGNTERAHLIIDVRPNPKIMKLLDNSRFFKGKVLKKKWESLTVKAWLSAQKYEFSSKSSVKKIESQKRKGQTFLLITTSTEILEIPVSEQLLPAITFVSNEKNKKFYAKDFLRLVPKKSGEEIFDLLQYFFRLGHLKIAQK